MPPAGPPTGVADDPVPAPGPAPRLRPDHRAAFWIFAIGMLVLDQAVKAWARGAEGQFGGRPWPGVFELTLTYNEGIAFGKLQGYGEFLTPVALIIAGFAVRYSWKHPHDGLWNHLTAALLASGAIGNMIDRLWLGKVTDMFWIRAINFPVFNIADVCISIAAGMLIITWLREEQAQRKQAAAMTRES